VAGPRGGPGPGVEIEPAALEEILGERGSIAGRDGLREFQNLIDRVGREIDAGRAGEGRHFLDERAEQTPGRRRLADDTDRLARDRGRAGPGAEPGVLLPQRPV